MSSVKRKTGAGDSVGFAATVNKALQPGAEWPDLDELLDLVYWGKQGLALIVGVLFGVLNLCGFLAIGAYLAISTLAPHQYVVKFQKVQDDESCGFMGLAKEGFAPAMATFLVAWITTYTSLYS